MKLLKTITRLETSLLSLQIRKKFLQAFGKLRAGNKDFRQETAAAAWLIYYPA
jgi:Leu/Phe-tRNA-protein transferase